jgi:hypothetical protein
VRDGKPQIVNAFPPGEFRPEWRQIHLWSHQQIPVTVDVQWSNGRRTVAHGSLQSWAQSGVGGAPGRW